MKKENKNLYEYKSELLSLSNEKTNSMKNLVHCLQCIVLSILFCVNSVRAQEIEFDANTLTLNADPEIFKVGAVIKIKVIEDDPSTKPDIEVTISFSDVRNEAGIQKFKDTGIKDTKAASTGGYYLMSFRVENKDYTNITVKVIGDKFTHERTYKIRNHGGIKFDVSTGFLGTKVRDRSYVLSDSAGIGNKVIREKDGKFRGGICLLAHLHSRNPDLLNIGANIGFELNQDSKIS
ncbi:MAG: hypothetical protein HOP11_14435 [Saprospiraceae bacterium]|nr:hypothetical protein [Saprospiraceae bacterium]